MNALFIAAGAAQAAEPSVLVVAGTGISLVFLVLILLTFIITLQGKIFDVLADRKKEAAAAAAQKSQPKPPAVQAPAAVPASEAPVVEDGISEEIVAVIAAAVAAASGGQYTLRAVKRAGGRGNWGAAGIKSGTEPF